MDGKMLISSVIFIIITLLKLIFPDQTRDLRQQTVALIDMDMDYRRWVTEVGSFLTEEAVYETMNFVDEQVSVDVFKAESLSNHLITDDIDYKTAKDEMIHKIENFKLSQEAYSEYELPENVSYAFRVLPFPYEMPVSGATSSGFGYRMHPIDGTVTFHYGTDYDVREGTPILSFSDGVVSSVGEEPGYGKYICISHSNGWGSLYAHCSSVNVASGQTVRKGEMIGESGKTGRVTGPHLHFELMQYGVYTNPEFYLS